MQVCSRDGEFEQGVGYALEIIAVSILVFFTDHLKNPQTN